ncbi:MAG: HD domain-containing protein, partial [Planctomycetota bacterium]
ATDAGHDAEHVTRVVHSARRLGELEGTEADVVLPAAWLHDCVQVPKDSPERARASLLAADAAVDWLQTQGYPAEHLDDIHHAIHAHSFSARVPCRSTAARVVQDADRLDAIGAIGIARALLCGAGMGRPLYDPDDPFCDRRPPDDRIATLDHFHTKLLHLAGSMQTAAGRAEAEGRSRFMRDWLEQLRRELP